MPATRPASPNSRGLPPDLHDVRHLWLKAGPAGCGVLASFVATYFARDLQDIVVGEWPLGYWIAAQGRCWCSSPSWWCYAWAMTGSSGRTPRPQWHRLKGAPCGAPPWLARPPLAGVRPHGCGLTSFHLVRAGVLGFLALMTWAEHQGLSRHWIGPIFLSLTVMVYAGIGVYGRTTDSDEYYVAGGAYRPCTTAWRPAAD